MEDVDDGRRYTCAGAEGIWEISVASAPFC